MAKFTTDIHIRARESRTPVVRLAKETGLSIDEIIKHFKGKEQLPPGKLHKLEQAISKRESKRE